MTTLDDIRSALRGKTIYLTPYCHADHAWEHTRDWHVRRYRAIFDRVLHLLQTRPDFAYFMDSWSEFLRPCLEARPDALPLFRQMVAQGRFAIVGGQWSNVRPSHVGDETFIRNMVYGRRAVQAVVPGARLDTYANLDVGIGHSQVPQLIALGGYRFYQAWRPQKGLDDQGVPRSFRWQGLSGDTVLVTRNGYSGWSHATEFCPAEDEQTRDFACPDVDFDFTVQFAWDRYLKEAAAQPGVRTLFFCHGGDDNIPFVDAFYGFERDIPGLVARWNEAGLGTLRFGTPHDVFDALAREAHELPVSQGLLDPAELCYHIARNGKLGVWWLRDLADAELLMAEQLAARAAPAGHVYPSGELDHGWQEHLTFCTHAIEFLFDEDYDNGRFRMQSAIHRARDLQRRALADMADGAPENDPSCYMVFNPLPEARRAYVEWHIPNIDNARRQPVLTDAEGNTLPTQVTYLGHLSRDFDVLVDMPLPPGGLATVQVGWSSEDLVPAEPEPCPGLDAALATDAMRLVFEKGRLVRVENLRSGGRLAAVDPYGLLDAMVLPMESDYWMPRSFADDPLPFVPESLAIEERGPLRHRIVRTGHSGPHRVLQEFDLYAGRATVDVRTSVDVLLEAVNMVIGLPLDPAAQLHADIPFGVEARDLGQLRYGHMGGGRYENIERRIPGIFWARSWVFAAHGAGSCGLITRDGPRYFRRHGNPQQLLHFLAGIKAERRHGWVKKAGMERELGRHTFHHRLVLDGPTWEAAGMVARSQRARTALPVFPGRALPSLGTLQVEPVKVRLSAYYRDGDDVLVRLVNMSGTTVPATVVLPFLPATIQAIDFLGQPVDGSLEQAGPEVHVAFAPWQIVTLRCTA